MKGVVLIGYRTSGKSSVSKFLEIEYGFFRVSTDSVIENDYGKSISKLVTEKGWDFFREFEHRVLSKIVIDIISGDYNRVVIDTGGGIVLRKDNVDLLKKVGKLFYLKATPELIISRMKVQANRPRLTNLSSLEEEIKRTLAERIPLYERYADYIIDVDEKEVKEIGEEIISFLL